MISRAGSVLFSALMTSPQLPAGSSLISPAAAHPPSLANARRKIFTQREFNSCWVTFFIDGRGSTRRCRGALAYLRESRSPLKSNRDILPEKAGTLLARYPQCKFGPPFPNCSKLIFSAPVNFLTTYRKIFPYAFTSNLATFVVFIAKAKGAPTASNIVNVSANLMVAILFRQEHFVNLSRRLRLPSLTPFRYQFVAG
jgi:hypothetical protein